MVQREDMERWGGDSERSTDNTKRHLSDDVLAERPLLPPGPDVRSLGGALYFPQDGSADGWGGAERTRKRR